MAPADVHVSVGVTLTPAAPEAGFGELGMAGSVAAAAVVKDHTGPVVVPPELRATIRQKYVVELARPVGAYEAAVWPVVAAGGGLAVPNKLELVAPVDVQVSVRVLLHPSHRAGEGPRRCMAAAGAARVVNFHCGPDRRRRRCARPSARISRARTSPAGLRAVVAGRDRAGVSLVEEHL